MSVIDIARPEIASLKSYSCASHVTPGIRLNANEAFCSPWADQEDAILNRYPELQPLTLRRQLAELYQLREQNVLATRGSSEAIDMLVRTFCRAYQDDVLITPPTFEMYRVYAEIQGANVLTAPLQKDNGFAMNTAEVLNACTPTTKLVFLCSPNNPTGSVIPRQDVLDLCAARAGQSVIVVDEAYVEFSTAASLVHDVVSVGNLVVLRTLSKAYALAGARCGAAIGEKSLVSVLSRVASPYSFATPVMHSVCRALRGSQLENVTRLISEVIAQREQLRMRLQALQSVDKVWPSQGNFLLVKFHNLAKVHDRLKKDGILIREFADDTGLEDCARITIGSADENDTLVRTLAPPQGRTYA